MFGVWLLAAQKPMKKLVENKVCFISETGNFGGSGHISNQKGQLPPHPHPLLTTSGQELVKVSFRSVWAEGRVYMLKQHSQLCHLEPGHAGV